MERGGNTHERSWAATEVVWDKDCEKMWRIVAIGWQPRGMGKGDDFA